MDIPDICLRALFACVLLFTATSGMVRGATRCGDLAATPVSQAPDTWCHGYLEHRALVENLSRRDAHRALLFVPRKTYGSGSSITRIQRETVIAPGSRAEISLFQPPLRMYGSSQAGLDIDNDGVYDINMPSVNASDRIERESYHQKESILVSRKLDMDNIKVMATSFMSRTGQKTEFTRAESSVEGWSDNWLGYTCYDGIVLTGQEVEKMPSAVREAFWSYVECGGSVLVLGGCLVPDVWRSTARTVDAGSCRYCVGFGECFVSETERPGKVSGKLFKEFNDSVRRTLIPWQNIVDVGMANARFPVVENLTTPTRGIFLIIILFAFLIGPVNLFVLMKLNKRIMLLVTVPVFSFLTCGIVFMYSMFSEGITATVRQQNVTILDQASRKTVTLGRIAFYCPLSPSDGLHFSRTAEITPILEDRYGGGRRRGIDWTIDQHFHPGWVTARVPAHFMARKVQTRRERLVLENPGGADPEVMNGLGADILKLWFADAEGNVFSCSDLSAGESATLEPDSKRARKARWSELRSFYSQRDWVADTNAVDELLQPGCYLAVLDGCPFGEKGLSGRARRRERAMILGILEKQPGQSIRQSGLPGVRRAELCGIGVDHE